MKAAARIFIDAIGIVAVGVMLAYAVAGMIPDHGPELHAQMEEGWR